MGCDVAYRVDEREVLWFDRGLVDRPSNRCKGDGCTTELY